MQYRKRILYLIVFLILLLANGIILYTFYRQIQNYADTAINIHETTIFTLPAGIGRVRLESFLMKQKIINSTNYFQWLLRLHPQLAQFKAGTYRLNPGMSLQEMLGMFYAGKEAQFSLLFIEGSRFEDWEKTLHKAPYLRQTINNQSADKLAKQLGLSPCQPLEGWFYPDTYYYTAEMNDIDILKRAHKRMLNAVKYEWEGRAQNVPYKTPYQMLIMASIIEKETAIDIERTKVASVFINRLKKKMHLQTDPTVIYSLGNKYRGVLYRSDLDTDSPYNTYLIVGLPLSPIAMPGRASIKAAAHPDETNYFYFVATGNGGHTFTSNINDHNQAVKHYRQIKDKMHEKSLYSY